MTIRMLRAWSGNPEQAIVTLSTSEEARLVAAGLATTDLDGDPADLADRAAALAAALANYGLVIEPGTTLYVGPTDPSAQMSVGDVWIDSSAA